MAENEHDTGHDVHFLSRLSRVSVQQTELALRLYRDPYLVRAILADRGVPESAPRVAIALAPDGAPAHVLVERSGAFVTCLAAGMAVGDAPVVPFERLEVHLGRAEYADELWEKARPVLDQDARTVAIFRRLSTAGTGLSREEYRELQAVEPFVRHAARGCGGCGDRSPAMCWSRGARRSRPSIPRWRARRAPPRTS
ncbi:MAG: hypothetical protein HY906_27530 [Deltaproteobacteria bacterium]|nr:hypothetical protein [Deltaproteobacteria bacterium]